MGRHKTRRCAVGLKRRKRNDALSLGKKRCAVGSQLMEKAPYDYKANVLRSAMLRQSGALAELDEED